MKYTVRLLSKASKDSDDIYRWLAAHSPQGAAAWQQVFEAVLDELQDAPERFGLAPDSGLGLPFRQKSFKTRRGLRYRLIFTIEAAEVFVFRVRGPGQQTLRSSDL